MLKQLDDDRFIVKASHGPRYVVGCRRKVRVSGRARPGWARPPRRPPRRPPPCTRPSRSCAPQLDKSKLVTGTRVTLDMTTYTVMRALPREVDPTVYEMLHEDPGNVSFSSVGGLNEQIRELREVIELPLTNPELFKRVGIKPPKARGAEERVRDGVSKGLGVTRRVAEGGWMGAAEYACGKWRLWAGGLIGRRCDRLGDVR